MRPDHVARGLPDLSVRGREDHVGELERGTRKTSQRPQRAHLVLARREGVAPALRGAAFVPDTAFVLELEPRDPSARVRASSSRSSSSSCNTRSSLSSVRASCRPRRTTSRRPATRRLRRTRSIASLESLVTAAAFSANWPSSPANPREPTSSSLALAACDSACSYKRETCSPGVGGVPSAAITSRAYPCEPVLFAKDPVNAPEPG